MNPRTLITGLLIVMVLMIASCSEDDESSPTEPIVTVDNFALLVSSMNDFSWELFADAIQYRDSGNVHIHGPANYRTLGWVYIATYDETYDEIKSTLGLDQFDDSLFMRTLATVTDSIERTEGATLASFDMGVFNRVAEPLDSVYARRTEQYFDGVVYSIDYADSLLDDSIRIWMETTSHDEYTSADGSGELIETFALYNMSYFHGEWELGIDTTANVNEVFHHPYLGDTLVETMLGSGTLNYYWGSELEFVDIPFGESGFSLSLVLPELPAWPLPASIAPTAERIETWLGLADTTAVTIHMPTFKMFDAYNLRESLERMGVYRLFLSTQSQWLPLAHGLDGHVSSFWESIRTRFTSGGTTIASAKPVGTSAAEVRVNRPFYYALRDNKTGAVLSMGRVMEPW